MSALLSFFKSRAFWLNVLAAFVVLVMFFGAVYKWLDTYTRHGETITVPDLRGRRISQLEDILKSKNLKYEIADSSIFDLNLMPGSIIEQDPKPNELVKEGRTIYITITRTQAPNIEMPDLVDVSLRQAQAILQSFGLKIGDMIYKPDLCNNCVLSMQVRGYNLKAGDRVAKGTTIDLVLGDGLGNTLVPIPDLNNLTYDAALFVLKGSGLLPGIVEYDNSVTDSASAIIYLQDPEPSDSATIAQGHTINLYLKKK